MQKTYFSPDRLVFKGPSSGQSSGQEVQAMTESEKQQEKPKSMTELNEESKKALAVSEAEKANIERRYGKPDGQGELPDGTPSEIRDAYTKLNETIDKLRSAIGRQRAIMEESLKRLGDINSALDAYSAKSKKESESGDPLAPLPFERAPEPSTETAVEPEPVPQAKPAPAPDKKETRESANDRVITEFCTRFEEGANEVNEEEAKVLRQVLKPGDLYLHEVEGGNSYEFEISKDKKWVRVTSRAPEQEGKPRGKYTAVLALEADAKGEAEFTLKTDEEALTAQIESNKSEAKSHLEWLAGDDAPLGSVLILFTKIETRKNYETGKDERFMQSYTVKKGVDGLRFATLEYPIDENDNALGPIREVRSDKRYTLKNALAMVAEKGTIVSQGNEKDSKAEIKKGLGDLGYNLIAQLPLGGEKSPTFQQTLRDINQLLARYNVTKWSYRHPHINYLARYAKGELTIYDPDKKNPDYVSPEQTPDVSRYAAVKGPIDMSQYA
jgi:hypothetical protein